MKIEQNKQFGQTGEDLATDFLISNGYSIITRNYHTAYGEIDVIAKQGNTLVFIEVKARSSSHQAALNSVSSTKQNKLINTASIFLSKNPDYESLPTRFDIISIINKNNIHHLHHMKDAFR